jgi:hypothetical protein
MRQGTKTGDKEHRRETGGRELETRNRDVRLGTAEERQLRNRDVRQGTEDRRQGTET